MEIDGSQKSGSGTILRLSVALAGILNEPLHVYNIRQKRSQPGLRPQHLEAVLTAAKICNAGTKGVTLGSREIWFEPNGIKSGEIHAEIGTAGSIPMLLLTILPIACYAKKAINIHVTKGGTDVSHSPTINYLKHVLIPIIERMGLKTDLKIKKYGYYPKGMGEALLEIHPCKRLSPIHLEEFGTVEKLRGISVCTFLEDRRVAERQAKAAKEYLGGKGYKAEIHVLNDKSNPLQKGSSIALWAETSTRALLGSDAIGELHKLGEVVGREAAEKLFKEIEAQATVDVHLADILVPYAALADGDSIYLTRVVTDHLKTNIWLAQKILGVKFKVTISRGLYLVEKK